MTLVENVKFLDQVDAILVMTKTDALRRRIFKPDQRKNHVPQLISYYFARYYNSHTPGRLRCTAPNINTCSGHSGFVQKQLEHIEIIISLSEK